MEGLSLSLTDLIVLQGGGGYGPPTPPAGNDSVTWGDGTNVEWSDGTQADWSS